MSKTKILAIIVAVVGTFLYVKTNFFHNWNWERHYQAGWEALDLGDVREAERHFSASLKETENFAKEDPRTRRSLRTLMDFYLNQENLSAAEPLIERLLALNRKSLGPDHANVAALLNNLAEVHRKLGSYEKAVSYYNQALNIWQKTLGPEDPLVIHIRKIHDDTLKKAGMKRNDKANRERTGK